MQDELLQRLEKQLESKNAELAKTTETIQKEQRFREKVIRLLYKTCTNPLLQETDLVTVKEREVKRQLKQIVRCSSCDENYKRVHLLIYRRKSCSSVQWKIGV